MANPDNRFSVFDFYTNDFSTLERDLQKEVGHKVKPKDVWSITIQNHELRRLSVTLVIIYWKKND